MMDKFLRFISKQNDCAKRSAKTFFQAFAAVLLTTLGNAEYAGENAQTAIVKGALTAAIAAGICAVMNINREV